MKIIQTQQQKLAQQQKLTQQQVMLIRMLEMPLTELEQSVQAELDDNPALETGGGADDYDPAAADYDGAPTADDTFEERTEREEREEALDNALQRLGGDDEMPEATPAGLNYQNAAEQEEITYGDQTSFYDKLKEQMGEQELSEKQREIMEYIIGSLDNDGLLRKSLEAVEDELAVYHNIDVSQEEIEEVLGVLQDFDPAGIGARSLQECLLLQIDRKRWTPERDVAHDILHDHFDDFLNNRWGRLKEQMQTDDELMERARRELLRLNPKPGASLGETEGRNMQQITPDFIVDTADDGTVTFSISRGRVPELYVSPSFADMLKHYQTNKQSMSRTEKEALLYAREKVERAQGFIDAVKQRRHTLYVTMKAIIDIQRKYFQDGDESDLKPMILKDVADRTGLDISTISRVSNQKYAQTRWGTFRLRHFFSDSYRTENGEEMSTRRIKAALQEIVAGEDKHHPLNDDALKEELTRRGFPIARRTISKYREQMGIPIARLRKE